MAQTAMVEKTVYDFSELSQTAKEHAIGNLACDYGWWDGVYDDFSEILNILGFEVKSDDIQFSGFYTQGSYAAFSGYYYFRSGISKGIKEYAPNDAELQRIAKELTEMQRKCFYNLSAKFSYSNYYGYSVDMEDGRRQYGWLDANCDAETVFRQVLKDLSAWLFNALQDDYEDKQKEENFLELCEANEWTFDENGNLDFI